MSGPVRHDCLVIGAGLAGSMAALCLARAGRDVLLVERATSAAHKVCGEFLSPEAVHYLRAAGVDPAALGAVPINRLRLGVRGSIVETALPFQALSLSRFVLDESLLARAAACGCAVRRGHAVESLRLNDGGWSALLAGSDTVTAAHVFLATGKHDLRGWARPSGTHGDLVGFKAHLRLSPSQQQELSGQMDLFLFRSGYGGLSLVEDGLANLCLVVRQTVLRRLNGWSSLIARIVAENNLLKVRLAGACQMWKRPLAVSPIPYGYLARSSGGAWLVGAQAAVIPSFAGAGMSIALQSGSMAAEMFLAAQAPEDYLALLRGQLHRGMRLATMLSQAMVNPAGRALAAPASRIFPQAMRWIAAATRIPAPSVGSRGSGYP